jgi:serine/threonine-protein kinase
MPLDQAIMVLSGLQLKLASTGQTESEQPPNTVLTQSIAAGQVVDAGSMVSVTTAIPRTVQVPSVVGLTRAAAQAALTPLKLQLVVSSSAINNLAAGLIVSQTPGAGSKTSQGSSVSVVLSLGPKVVAPRLVGTALEDAQAIANSRGLVLATTFKLAAADGIVLQQAPAAGTAVDPHSTIHVVVGTSRNKSSLPNRILTRINA